MNEIIKTRIDQFNANQKSDPSYFQKKRGASDFYYESWLVVIADLEEAKELNKSLVEEISNLKIENAKIAQKLSGSEKNKWITFVMSFLATIFSGLGVNYITSDSIILGVYLLIVSVIFVAIEFISIILK